MSPFDDFVPPDIYLDFDQEDEFARLQLAIREQSRRNARVRREQRRNARNGDPMASDSDDSGARPAPQPAMANATILTPAGSTPKENGEEKKQELVKLDPKEVGMTSGYKHLYSGKEDKRGRFQWQNEVPEDVGKPAEDADAQRYAILVRHIKVFHDPRRVLSMHSIVIQSPLLKDLLGNVLSGYPGVTVGLQRLEFSGRFEPLIHRWREFEKAILHLEKDVSDRPADEDAADKLKHAKLLHKLLADEFREVIDSSKDMTLQGVMTYDLLWSLFQPGQFIYAKVQGQDRIFRLHSSRYGTDRNGNPVYWISCQFIDYDGTRFGTNKLNIQIPKFEGTKPINHLAVLPLSFHSQEADTKAKLIQRGSKVEAFAGSHYRAYNGVGWRMGNMGQIEKYSVKGRIVIDGYGWNRFNPNYCVYVMALHARENDTATGFGGGEARGGEGGDPFGEDEYNGDESEDDGGMPLDGFFVETDDEDANRIELSDEQRMICTPFVRGYALKEKIWLNFFVNAIQDVSFNTKAFESLVLPSNQKELILGFTATQQSYRSQFDDVIEGKGRGIILLLCGPPGVGKTLTAESVAEEMRVPLYCMSAGDLGLDPRHVESKLQGILDMCTRWNAILLLDEADVFLEERSLHELERNKLVSIFLRVLEYYEGIMFLTTNRVQTFDAAFQSRIHISIDYPELSVESRRTVWENFLAQHDVAQAASRDKPLKPLASAARSPNGAAKSPDEAAKSPDEAAADAEQPLPNGTAHADGATTEQDSGGSGSSSGKDDTAAEVHRKRTLPHQMSKRDVDGLSLMNMNGRQIKNVLKTAQLLASKRGEGLGKTHVMTVLDVTQHLHNATREKESTRSSIFS